MVYPGLPGQVGPPPLTAVGQQIRQSTAGSYPGGKTYTTVIAAMGYNAPAAAVTAAAVTVMEEAADEPFSIEEDNFESAAWATASETNPEFDG